MKTEDVSEILLLSLRMLRSEASLLDDLAASLHALREVVVGQNQALEAQFQKFEAESASASKSPRQATLRMLDDIIQKLECRRPPHVN